MKKETYFKHKELAKELERQTTAIKAEMLLEELELSLLLEAVKWY